MSVKLPQLRLQNFGGLIVNFANVKDLWYVIKFDEIEVSIEDLSLTLYW